MKRLKHFSMTIALICTIVVIFIADTFFLAPKGTNIFSADHLIFGDKSGKLTGALMLSAQKVHEGQVWRLFTSMALHAGLLHLICNVFAFLNIGIVVEPLLKRSGLLAAFLGGGVFSALCMVSIFNIEAGLGASTAISALFGVFAVLIIMRFKDIFPKIKWYQWVFVGLSIGIYVYGDGTAVTRFEHLTGFIAGIYIGLVYIIAYKRRTKRDEF